MPPKKVVEEVKLGPWALGRFSSNLKVRTRRFYRARCTAEEVCPTAAESGCTGNYSIPGSGVGKAVNLHGRKEVERSADYSPRGCCAIQVGIVGMPNVGKSTLYNCLTKCSIPAENFPFCTIDPNSVRTSAAPS